MAKAQMEIMGLAVIVILVAIGLFYMLVFSAELPESTPIQEYDQSQLGTNTLIAMLKTNLEGCGVTLEDAIYDLDTYNRLDCATEENIKNQMETMLESTLGEWGTKYILTAESGVTAESGLELFKISQGECNAQSEQKTSLQPIPRYPLPGTILLTIAICE